MARVELERSYGWLPPQVSGVRLEFSMDGLIASCVRRDGAVSQLQLSTDPQQCEAALSRWLESEGLPSANAAPAAELLVGRLFDARRRTPVAGAA
jgi:hypothetical protein